MALQKERLVHLGYGAHFNTSVPDAEAARSLWAGAQLRLHSQFNTRHTLHFQTIYSYTLQGSWTYTCSLFEVLVLSLRYITFLSAYSIVYGFWWRHIVNIFVLGLVSRHFTLTWLRSFWVLMSSLVLVGCFIPCFLLSSLCLRKVWLQKLSMV